VTLISQVSQIIFYISISIKFQLSVAYNQYCTVLESSHLLVHLSVVLCRTKDKKSAEFNSLLPYMTWLLQKGKNVTKAEYLKDS